LEIGCLCARDIIPQQSAEWDEPMRVFLDEIDLPEASAVSAFLARLRQLAGQYVGGGVQERNALLGLADTEVRAIRSTLGIAPNDKPIVPFFEDSTADATVCLRLTEDTAEALRELRDFIGVTSRASPARAEQARMRAFFETYYGSGVARVPLLGFYEDYYREHLKPHLARQGRPADADPTGYDSANPFNLDVVAAMQRVREQVADLFDFAGRVDPVVEEIKVAPETVQAAYASLPEVPGYRSASVFAQALHEPGAGARIVCRYGSYLPGFGKYFSRFLYLLPESLRLEVLANNATLRSSVLAEIEGDADFNANLHPTITNASISYPTSAARPSPDAIQCTALDVERDDSGFGLRLVESDSGRVIVPLDLGFLSTQLRPPLFRLLSSFMPPSFPGLHIGEPQRRSMPVAASSPEPMGHAPEATESSIVYTPRLLYGTRVVLSRRRWSIGAAQFPLQAPAESAGDYFMRVQRWRAQWAIPERVYARVRQLPVPRVNRSNLPMNEPQAEDSADEATADHDPESPSERSAPQGDGSPVDGGSVGAAARTPTNRGSRDYSKPQFIDFSSPLLVRLFSKLPGSLTRFRVILEESYPDVSQLPTWDGQPFVTELVLQVNIPAKPALPVIEEGR